MYVLAKLDDSQLTQLQAFEQREHLKVIAMQDVSVEAEMIDPEKLTALKSIEDRLGVCLVAVH